MFREDMLKVQNLEKIENTKGSKGIPDGEITRKKNGENIYRKLIDNSNQNKRVILGQK